MKLDRFSGPALAVAIILLGTATTTSAQPMAGQPPALLPQDGGWAYSRTGLAAGLDKLWNQYAVFIGSRYGVVLGHRVPLDDDDILHGVPVVRDGEVYVPLTFAAYFSMKVFPPDDPAPDYLKSRWVYHVPRPAYTPPDAVKTIQVNGRTYVNLAQAGAAAGLHFFQDDSGLATVGRKPDFDFTTHELNLHDDVVSAFDMPEKFASPPVAMKYILPLPALAPAPKPPAIPRAAYNFTGFNVKLLGSKVPAPGVYPRLLFSPEDLPVLQDRVKNSRIMQMSLDEIEAMLKNTWWNPDTPDGQMFQRLVSGQLTDYTSEQRGNAGIYSSQVNYPTNCLVSMALYCLLSGDNEHGKQAAAAIYNYYKFLEPRVDDILSSSPNELVFKPALAKFSPTQWQGMDDLVAHLDLGLALDFAGHWMTPDQIDLMRRVIAKATYGRRTTAGTGLSHLLAVAAIEGLPGYDAEGYAADAELAQSFLDWGFDEKGRLTDVGEKAGNLQFQILAMVALARRGDNLWGHPHWRNFLNGAPAAAYATVAGSALDPNDGGPYDMQTIMELRAFYPDNKYADLILSRRHPSFDPAKLDLALYDAQLANENAQHLRALKLRLPGPSYPGYVPAVLYDSDWQIVTRAE
jgi:hypothetical protein